MDQIAPASEQAILRKVFYDIEPPVWMVHAKIGGSIAMGGVVSLLICGQFGMSLTPLADHFERHLASLMGLLGCSVTCGLLFAIVPAALLRFVSSPLQFYVLTRRNQPVILGWIVATGFVLMRLSRASLQISDIVTWYAAAMFMFSILAWGLYRIATQPLLGRSP